MSYLKETLQIWSFGLFKVPMILFLSPKVVSLDEKHIKLKLPLSYKSKNHLGSMYFGALCAGADLAGGYLAYRLFKLQKKNVSLAFKEFEAKFLKRSEDDTIFICDQGEMISEFVDEVMESDERQNRWVNVKAYEERNLDEPVAEFRLLLSLKRK
ncbi:MAG: PaaI family thioesterase [Bacteriovoracaceae bacterium]